MSRTVLVTGAAGFIASHITRELVGRGYRVRAFDDLSGGMGWSRLEDLGDKVERITASLLDTAAVEGAVKGVE
ncbi:MAG: NAD-dependent epimerase/dehydratase family protein, partial [Phycisphaerales bacterium]|nr:NAD-dependent epimerase/dehydratase family protein [Phycisphaerales bacterium]